MIFKYFRGMQAYVPAASHVHKNMERTLSTWIGTSKALSEMRVRRVIISNYIGTLTGRVLLLCNNNDECANMLIKNPGMLHINGDSKNNERLELLDKFRDDPSGRLVLTVSMFTHISSSGIREIPVDHLVLTVYGQHKITFPLALRKFEPQTLHHIVDNVNQKGVIPKFVANMIAAGIKIDVDKSTLDCFKFNRSLDPSLASCYNDPEQPSNQ